MPIKSYNLTKEACRKVDELEKLIGKNKSEIVDMAIKILGTNPKAAEALYQKMLNDTNEVKAQLFKIYLEQNK